MSLLSNRLLRCILLSNYRIELPNDYPGLEQSIRAILDRLLATLEESTGARQEFVDNTTNRPFLV